MKHTLKTLAVAAALVAAFGAQAASVTVNAGSDATLSNGAKGTFLGGGGTLEFSNGTGVIGGVPTTSVGGLVGALNVGEVQLSPLDGANITENNVNIDGDDTRAVVKIGATVSSLTLDTDTGNITNVTSVGGAKQLASRIKNILNGGEVSVSNLRFDLVAKTVTVDAVGTPLVNSGGTWVPGTTTTRNNLVLWTFDSITGPTSLPPAAVLAAQQTGDFSGLTAAGFTVNGTQVTATDTLNNLRVTTDGFNFFAASLGLTNGSTGYTTLNGVNSQPDGWGSVTSTITTNISAVPEASSVSYALVGAGMVGFMLARRRRQQA